MKWQRLTSDLEFDLFKEKYLSRSGFDVSIEDLKRYDVYGFFDRGTLLGGFWLIQSAPYRTLDTLSPEYLKSDAAFSKALKRRLVEMGGMWKDKSVVGFGPSASYFVQGMFRILRGVRVDAWLTLRIRPPPRIPQSLLWPVQPLHVVPGPGHPPRRERGPYCPWHHLCCTQNLHACLRNPGHWPKPALGAKRQEGQTQTGPQAPNRGKPQSPLSSSTSRERG